MSWEYDLKRCPLYDSTKLNSIELVDCVREHVFYETRPWDSIEEFNNARESVEGIETPEKSIKDTELRRILIRRHLSAAEAGIRNRDSGRKSGAISYLRALRTGQIKPGWAEKATGSTILRRVSQVFGIDLTPDDWKNAGRKTRSSRVSLEGFDREVESLNASTL